MKKFLLIGVLAIALVLAMSTAALANFGPHGNYAEDTDACAGCHRAHTSFSPVDRTIYLGDEAIDRGGSALLVSSAQTMREFCYACHGDDAPGAATNVEAGMFDSGPSADSLGNTGGETVLYQTNSTFGETLNGGGFSTIGGMGVTSAHDMDPDNTSNDVTGSIAPVWGYGNAAESDGAATVLSTFTCTSCHDPHGSSNYRLLKDSLPAKAVGGYDALGNPDPYVISAEEGYPSTGWHKQDVAELAAYRPNYTDEEYRSNGLITENISGWCAGCHDRYDEPTSQYDYGKYLADGATEVGARDFHRHPVNRALGTKPNSSLAVEATTDALLPLELNPAKDTAVHRGTWDNADLLGCLTCHRAHGTSATMTGWAESTVVNNGASAEPSWTVQIDAAGDAVTGVNPNKSSALLRANNRGVCERCHNK